MPNRIIKESIKYSEQIDSLSWFEEVLFYRLIVSVDDYGCYDGRVVLLKNALFPTKEDVTKKMIEAALNRLESQGLIRRYTVNNRPYIQLPTWSKHQRLRNSIRKFPEPPEMPEIKVFDDLPQVAASCEKKTLESESESNTNIESESNTNPTTRKRVYVEDPAVNDAVKAFLEHRKLKKKPMSERAITLFLNKLFKLSADPLEQVRIIDQSIEHGWDTVYPLRSDGQMYRQQSGGDYLEMLVRGETT